MMVALADKIGARWEAAYPSVTGIAAGVVAYLYAPEHKWAIENIFVAIFTLGTVTAGFGLAIYTFLLTTESGFIGKTKRSIYYRHLLKYVLIATIASAILSIVSIPGMVVKDVPRPYSLHAIYIAVWAGVGGWTVGSLFRAGHLFSIFAREHH
jgi:uncharacterized membrane protein